MEHSPRYAIFWAEAFLKPASPGFPLAGYLFHLLIPVRRVILSLVAFLCCISCDSPFSHLPFPVSLNRFSVPQTECLLNMSRFSNMLLLVLKDCCSPNNILLIAAQSSSFRYLFLPVPPAPNPHIKVPFLCLLWHLEYIPLTAITKLWWWCNCLSTFLCDLFIGLLMVPGKNIGFCCIHVCPQAQYST